jgi:seryl-tRNA synthetase
MNITLKRTRPKFWLFFIIATMILSFSIYGQRSSNYTKQFLAEKPNETKSVQRSSKKKQHIVTIEDEIAFLKTEIKRINKKLFQIENNNVNLETALTTEEIQAIEKSNEDYEINLINSVNQVEDFFADLPENPTQNIEQETAIRQSLGINQTDMASIVDLHCKSTHCRLELKYDLTALNTNENMAENDNSGFSTNISSLLDVAVSQEINEIDQTGIAVIFLGQLPD